MTTGAGKTGRNAAPAAAASPAARGHMRKGGAGKTNAARKSAGKKAAPPAKGEGKKPPNRPQRKPRRWRRRGTALLRLCAVCCLFVSALAITAEIYVSVQSSGRHVADAKNIPSGQVGLVLACPPRLGDRENPLFANRMAAAAALWRSGSVRCLIVSGAEGTPDGSGPASMRAALIRRGVPGKYIVCDCASPRTLDSVLRARHIFGAENITFVAQEFHNKRALAIAARFGIDARALDAEDPPPFSSFTARLRAWLRERAARTAMLAELFLLNREPRCLGEAEPLPELPDRRPRGIFISY